MSSFFIKQRSYAVRRGFTQVFSSSSGPQQHRVAFLRSTAMRPFSVLTEQVKDTPTLPMFTVGTPNGFLPRQDPLAVLPDEFKRLESLLQRMPLQLLDGQPGLLASGQFGEAVKEELPLYDVDHIDDQHLLSGKNLSNGFLPVNMTDPSM